MDWVLSSVTWFFQWMVGLVGGFKVVFFHPYLGKMFQCWLIFFKWVETTNQGWLEDMEDPRSFRDGIFYGAMLVLGMVYSLEV